jgi:hypothetical protein
LVRRDRTQRQNLRDGRCDRRGRNSHRDEAAAFVGLHPDTLRERAASAIIPGAKTGKEWRFLDIDLVAYVRGRYRRSSAEHDKP